LSSRTHISTVLLEILAHKVLLGHAPTALVVAFFLAFYVESSWLLISEALWLV
jgi:hypothetical protein